MKIEIEKKGDFKCLIEINDQGEIKLLGAIDGYGRSVIECVIIEELKED